MPREQIPVNPAVLTWARERAGYSRNQAAEVFKKISSWEAGEEFPTYPQLEKLADTFRIPVAVFFFPDPPNLPPIEESFRTLPQAEFEQIPPRVRLLLRKAAALQLNLNELCQGQNPARRLITHDLRLQLDQDVADLAHQVREYIGVPLDRQIQWPSAKEAFKRWRSAILDVGVFVFKDAFRQPDYSGFCLYDEVFPIIYVNNSMADTRQCFTLFHELAHLLFQTSGIDTLADHFVPGLPDRSRQIEVLCNRFAAEFLLPETEFAAAFAGHDATEESAESLASRFHVSRELIYRKFLDRGLIDRRTYEEASGRWADQRRPGRGGNPYWTKISYLGREYIQLALSQYHQNRISETQLAQYLDSKPRYVGTLEEYFARGDA